MPSGSPGTDDYRQGDSNRMAAYVGYVPLVGIPYVAEDYTPDINRFIAGSLRPPGRDQDGHGGENRQYERLQPQGSTETITLFSITSTNPEDICTFFSPSPEG